MSTFEDQRTFQALRDIVGERTKPILIWAGAGLSVAAGLPSWEGLKSTLLKAIESSSYLLDVQEANDRAYSLDRIRRSTDLWRDFGQIKELLGPTSFRAEVTDALSTSSTVAVPKAYELAWRIRPEGILTLNIDRLASRAASGISKSTPVEKTGRDIAKLRDLLHDGRPFIGNLHGEIDDADSWVFTASDLKALTSKPGYRFFIETCLADFTNIFVGISPQDRAVGGHLDSLRKLRLQSPPNYWLTSRTDLGAQAWAEDRGIRVVRYKADNDHAELLEILESLVEFIPSEETAAPPVFSASSEEAGEEDVVDLTTANLAALSTNQLRAALNKRAVVILHDETDEAYKNYEAFSQEYHEEIYRAWYVTTQAGSNKILGYTLAADVARGGFGRVFRGQDMSGNAVAVKVLLDEVRRDPALLASFRRGVRSMAILGKAGIDRMVRYRDATEIPAIVVMDWIEGPNLEDAVRGHLVSDWPEVLEIAIQVASTLRAAHSLPERVLHRDLRPANIMLRDYWTNGGQVDSVLLDFDLSWHKGAAERSIVFTSVSGYLAPEQQVENKKESTRHAAVDSFGFGMTLYYLTSGKDPLANSHVSPAWPTMVVSAARTLGALPSWRSLPQRFARLVIGATADLQRERWDLARIDRELVQLRAALLGGQVENGELIAEELAARSEVMSGYHWDDDRRCAVMDSPSGLRVAVFGSASSDDVCLEVSVMTTGSEDRSSVGRYLNEALATARARLGRVWSIDMGKVEMGSYQIRAHVRKSELAANLDASASSLDAALIDARKF